MKKIIIAASLLTACVAFANPYAKCAACHGANGEKAALGKSKIIKDLSKADFVSALKGYQDGTYGGAQKGLMVGQVKDMTEATMNEIADTIIK
ncbi:MAG: c-type cytochrome [Arcobacteraceae bacterium]|nr:cytochrome C [Campylobacterales bacterium]